MSGGLDRPPDTGLVFEKVEVLAFFVFVVVITTLLDVVLWLRFLRPTPVVWERRSRLIAATIGVVPPLCFLPVVAQYVGIIK